MKRRNPTARLCASFVLPGLIYMLLVVGYPLIYNIVLSFKNLSVMNINNGNVISVGFQNYITLWEEGILKDVLKNTVVFTFFCIIFQFSLGLIFALFFRQNFKLAAPIRGLLLVIWVIPATVTALIFKFMFQTDGGLINDVLMNTGIIKTAIPWLTSGKMAMISVVITNCWVGMPFNMILLTSGLNSIPSSVYESAKLDGASSFQSFLHITLPLLRPSMMSVLIMGVIYTFKCFDLIYVMTAGGPIHATQLLSTYSYRLSFKEYQFSQGAAAANILFLCLAIVAAFYLLLIKKDETI